MKIEINIPEKIIEHCAKIGISESKTEEVIICFLDDILDLHSNEKLLEKFKKWEIERNGIH